MTRRRKAKGRDDIVHLLRQVHCTETRKVKEKVAMTEVFKAPNFKTGSRQRGSHVIVDMFPNVQHAKLQVDADSETSVFSNTAKSADENRHSASIAIHIP